MGETLEALLRLQEVETKLAVIRRKRESKARRVEIQRRQAKHADENLEEHKRMFRERQMKLDALTLEVAAEEESISKHREALNKARTNKEYAAILTQMNTEKADNAKRENGILRFMEEIQTLKEEAATLEADRAKVLGDVQTAEEALRAFDAESREDMDRLEAARDEHSDSIAAGTLSSFARVAQRNDGEAMAPVVRLHPKRLEFACSGCNMTISLEVFNSLRSRDDLQLCHSCGRILFLEGATAEG